MPSTLLPDRAIVQLTGNEARVFLQGLLTCNLDAVSPSQAAYGALLSPQGKILTDFFLCETPDGALLFDLPATQAADFVKRLTLYRLRAKIAITALADARVAAVWDEPAVAATGPNVAFNDPRHAGLGQRVLYLTQPEAGAGDGSIPADYDTHRIRLGVPQGGLDFPYGDTFPHDANLDLLHGLDFQKGCYVGQEVVSRVQHRGSARKRILPVRFLDGAGQRGAPILADDREIGTLGSVAGLLGLAMLRTDRLEEARAEGIALRAGSQALVVDPLN